MFELFIDSCTVTRQLSATFLVSSLVRAVSEHFLEMRSLSEHFWGDGVTFRAVSEHFWGMGSISEQFQSRFQGIGSVAEQFQKTF